MTNMTPLPSDEYPEDEQLELFALDLLDDDERAQVERRLAADPVARERVREMRGALALLAFDLEPMEPRPDLKMRVLEAARSETPGDNATRADADPPHASAEPVSLAERRAEAALSGPSRWIPWAVAAVLALALVGSMLWNLSLRSTPEGQTEAVAYSVTVTGSASGVTGEVLELPDDSVAVVSLAGLNQPEAGKVYQVWLIADGEPLPNVTFVPNEQGFASVAVPGNIGEFRTLAITIEPIGGSLAPTSDPIIIADLTTPTTS